jgi:hypothetical protein
MNAFSAPFRDIVTAKHVNLVPLLEVVLPDGTEGYMSNRRVDVNGHIYVRRIVSWSGISQDIKGSNSSATFTLSNVDRLLEIVARDHMFTRALVTFRLYSPELIEKGSSFADSSRMIWKGYVSEISYDNETFVLNCKDGLYALSLSVPRRRLTRNCHLPFDDGCYCPYSGYARQQERVREEDGSITVLPNQFVSIESLTGVVGPEAPTPIGTYGARWNGDSDFGPPPDNSNQDDSLREGFAWVTRKDENAHYTTCGKTFADCYLRGMTRFFGGLRYVSAWAGGAYGKFGSIFNRANNSYSMVNESVFNEAVPMVYTNSDEYPVNPLTGEPPEHGLTVTPLIFQWRPEKEYLAAEGIISLGRVGSPDDDHGGLEEFAIKDVYLNGKGPIGYKPAFPSQAIQFSKHSDPHTWGFGIQRSGGRIGEPALLKSPAGHPVSWEQIGGDLVQGDEWISPLTPELGPQQPPSPVFLSQLAGVVTKIIDKDAGINNPQTQAEGTGSDDTKYASSGMPNMKAALDYGRWVWRYHNAENGDRTYDATAKGAWVLFDLVLDATDSHYAIHEIHESIVALQTFIDLSDYCEETLPNIVNPEYDTVRYIWSGSINEAKSALDHVDNILKDMYAFRFWRDGKLAVAPIAACQFDTTARPGFQEFVNIVDGSFKVKIPQPKYNTLAVKYPDADFDYKQNTATIYSEGHQLLLGQNGKRHELTKSETLTGTPTTDQANRIGIRMLKDELGGSTQIEWQRLREVELDSTFMMHELEVGDATYVAHTLLPDGGQWMRVQSWSLNADLTMHYTLRTFNIANYDDIVVGLSSVELAKFGWNPFIPGSGGIAYKMLPKIYWDSTDPITAQPYIGIHLNWLPYDQPHYPDDYERLNARLMSVFIYRTPGTALYEDIPAPGVLSEDDPAISWPVRTLDNLPDLPFPARVDKECVEVYEYDLSQGLEKPRILVHRGLPDPMNFSIKDGIVSFDLTPTDMVEHKAGAGVVVDLYYGGFLAKTVNRTATTWLVSARPYFYKVGEKYLCDGEIIQVTAIVTDLSDPVIHVLRGQKLNDEDPNEVASTPTPHRKLRQIRSVWYLDQVPDSRIAQAGNEIGVEYTDPWLGPQKVGLRSVPVGTSMVIGELRVNG